jgi:hypothetical protein
VSESLPPGEGQQRTTALSKELSEFLLDFSIGVHRYSMYPPDHPSLGPAAGNVTGRLAELLVDRRILSIGVAQEQLVIEGVATESKHPVLADLAKRLHGHQLGAVTFAKGFSADEIEALLKTLAQDPEREGDSLGLLPREEIPRWDHVTLYPVGYDQLELTGDAGALGLEQERAKDLWLGLACAAMETDEIVDPESVPEARSIAEVIQAHQREAAYDQVIVGYLLQLAEELKAGKGGEAESIRKRVSALVRELDVPTLQRLVEMGGSETQRRRFVMDANQSLAVDAVVKIVQAAANASQQTISHSLTRLLFKLSSQADAGVERVRSQADDALRENVEELIKDWELVDPNPDGYTLILDSMAQSAPVFDAAEEGEGELLSGAHRLVQMSLEVDSWGPTVAKAVSDLVEAGEVEYLLELADSASGGSQVGERLREFLTSPTQLRRLLSGEDVQEETLDAVVSRMGTPAIPILLEILTESEARSIRRKVFDVLAGFGEEVGPFLSERLDDSRWFVIRNMLALVRRLPESPQGFTAGPFLDHADARVRREAVALATREGRLRERALALGLADSDERLLRTVLLELQDSLPETLLPVLVSRVIRSDHDEDLRAMGVRALRNSHSNLVLETLLEVCCEGKSLLGKVRLAPPSPEVLAALQTLSRAWGEDRRAREVLSAARKAKDSRFRRALGGEGADE